MGSPVRIGALAPEFLGLQVDGMRTDVSGGEGDTVKQPPARTEWHSISRKGASRPEVEYCFKLVERKDDSETRASLFGSKDMSQQTRKLQLSLCGLSKYVDSNGNGDESKTLLSYPDGLKKDCSPYITMETLDSSNGLKEVRVSFHGLEETKKVCTGKGCNHDLSYGDDGCLSLVNQFRALLSSPKLSCGGLLSGDGKHSVFDSLGTILHSFKTPDSSPTKLPKDESNTKTGNQPETVPSTGLPKSSNVGCKESPERAVSEARSDLKARCDALPLAHYRPDCPVWCSKDQEQRRNGTTTGPNSNVTGPVHMNCKKPPKPPKPPRHPGRASSLDAASIAAAKAAAARRKALKQAVAKRKARVSAPANSGGTPLIALVLTLGFGILMVFQGLFVQSTATYGDSERSFVDVPSDHLGDIAGEKADSHGLPYQLETEVQSSSAVVDPGKADMVISNAFYKSMLEIGSSGNSQASYRTTATG